MPRPAKSRIRCRTNSSQARTQWVQRMHAFGFSSVTSLRKAAASAGSTIPQRAATSRMTGTFGHRPRYIRASIRRWRRTRSDSVWTTRSPRIG